MALWPRGGHVVFVELRLVVSGRNGEGCNNSVEGQTQWRRARAAIVEGRSDSEFAARV